MRNCSVESIVRKLNQMPVGYYHYYGVTDNSESLGKFRHQVGRRLYYWLNRRSQRRSYTLESFRELMKQYPPGQAEDICQCIWKITGMYQLCKEPDAGKLHICVL